jgi:hypothetical protein
VESFGKSAENNLAGNIPQQNGNSAKTRSATASLTKQRTVSPVIESRASRFEKEELSEAVSTLRLVKEKRSSESLKVGIIRKKASAEHNRLREMFEEGEVAGSPSSAFGRSVSPSFLSVCDYPFVSKLSSEEESMSENEVQSQMNVLKQQDEVNEAEDKTETKALESTEDSNLESSRFTREGSSSIDEVRHGDVTRERSVVVEEKDANDGAIDVNKSALPNTSIPKLMVSTHDLPTSHSPNALSNSSPIASRSISPKRLAAYRKSMIPKLAIGSSPLAVQSPSPDKRPKENQRRPTITPTSSILSPAITTTLASNHTVEGASSAMPPSPVTSSPATGQTASSPTSPGRKNLKKDTGQSNGFGFAYGRFGFGTGMERPKSGLQMGLGLNVGLLDGKENGKPLGGSSDVKERSGK